MKIISLAAIAMVRGLKYEISFFDERERERGGGKRDCPTFVENICIDQLLIRRRAKERSFIRIFRKFYGIDRFCMFF